ncbi:hypothetical protein RB195_012197 [Necator americanus]|uniref:ShKT domain-containing protein n=1 Tax=Necator americanus TaxID=51031 RepID=A0ABR1D5Z5_NECAM
MLVVDHHQQRSQAASLRVESAIRPSTMYGSETWAAPSTGLIKYTGGRHVKDINNFAPPSKVAKVNRLRFFDHILRRSADLLFNEFWGVCRVRAGRIELVENGKYGIATNGLILCKLSQEIEKVGQSYVQRRHTSAKMRIIASGDDISPPIKLEIALRRVDPTVALPYWDSTLDSTLPNPRDSSMFTNELMGRQGPDGSIQTGAFRGWRTVDGSRVFRRNLGATGTLFQQSDINAVMAATDFRQVLAYTAPSPSCPNPAAWTAFEYSHGNPHIYVGGDMFQPITSTNDPIFWNHHSFVDLVWENWRVIRQSRAARETQYPPNNPSCSSAAHYGDNTMQPFFPMVNKDGLSNAYTDNLYSYAPRPTCSAANPSGCGSRFLFCDLSHGAPRCAAKIATPMPTTQPPIVTTTPAGPAQETCFNEQQCCAPWANRGQCRLNPAYMNAWCKASCGICRPTTYNLNSARIVTRCAVLGRLEENAPGIHPGWWKIVVKLVEDVELQGHKLVIHNQIADTPATSPPSVTPPPSSGGTCFNQHYCCIAWASRGYCSSRYDYMNQYCKPSCNLCRGSTPNSLWNSLTCADFSSQCTAWARQGQCNSNPTFMWENCKRSCGRCSLLNLVSRLVTCGFSRRMSRNRRPVSEFSVSPLSLPLRRQSSPVSLAPGSLTQISLAPAPATSRSLVLRTKDNFTER